MLGFDVVLLLSGVLSLAGAGLWYPMALVWGLDPGGLPLGILTASGSSSRTEG